MRSFVVFGAVLFLACTTTPAGLCEDDSGCLPGLRCDQGVCVGCGGDDQCQLWEACSADRRCELRAGMCADKSHCQAWEVCAADNTCQLAQGFCLAATDCKSYEDCDGTTRQCVLQAGRCTTADSCGSGDLWAATCGDDNWCHSGPPVGGNDVLLWGTLMEGTCGYDAISSVFSPTRLQVGFDCYTDGVLRDSVVAPNGRIYYVDWGAKPRRVKVFVPDRFKVEKDIRSYPPDGVANDTVLSAPGCKSDEDVGTFVMQAGTGSIAYNCGVSGGLTYYNPAGEVVSSGYRLSAWNGADYLLASNNTYQLVVLTPSRTAIPVTGLPFDWSYIIDQRAYASGFRVAIHRSGNTNKDELWRIDNEGVPTYEGTYGAFPENLSSNVGGGELDSAGALFTTTSWSNKWFVDAVVKRPPDGATGTVVYSEDEAPEKVNYSANYEKVFNFMHGSYLFTGP